jgi:hypothetical protein
MKMRCLLCACVLLAYGDTGTGADVQIDEVPEMTWDALMPQDWNPMAPLESLAGDDLGDLTDDSPEAAAIYAEAMASLKAAPVVAELNGEIIRLPGYLLPLEFAETSVKEFLLVPYFGACIHVPPPPSNQIVFVKSEEPIDISGMFDAVWVTGKIKTVPVSSELAEAGYTMEAIQVDPYEY